MARARSEDGLDGDSMPIFEVDGLPYIDADWLEWRIYRDSARASRWRQEAGRFYWRTDCEGRAIRAAYLTQSLQASYRVERWRRNLALTQAAIVGVQKDTRIGFGLLVKERRTAAGLSRIELSRLAGLDDKTIGNVERAGFFISRKSIEALIAVPQLRLSWADVGQELLEKNPADGRKHKRPRRSKTGTV
jgi:hypothetical protein